MSHHSSEEMNFAVSFKLAKDIKNTIFYFLTLTGLDPTIIAVAGVISTLWGIFGHTLLLENLDQ